MLMRAQCPDLATWRMWQMDAQQEELAQARSMVAASDKFMAQQVMRVQKARRLSALSSGSPAPATVADSSQDTDEKLLKGGTQPQELPRDDGEHEQENVPPRCEENGDEDKASRASDEKQMAVVEQQLAQAQLDLELERSHVAELSNERDLLSNQLSTAGSHAAEAQPIHLDAQQGGAVLKAAKLVEEENAAVLQALQDD
eukprot:gene31719-39984_t